MTFPKSLLHRLAIVSFRTSYSMIHLQSLNKNMYMSHSLKCFERHDVPLNLFSSRVPMTCDAKTRLYQYMGVTNPYDGCGLVMSHVMPLHITNIEILQFHDFSMVSLHFFCKINIMYSVAINLKLKLMLVCPVKCQNS